MSEYQYIAFRAIDAPVSEKNLAYMRRQSSRAEITPWSFTNEYHYGDFGGNAMEMLRRGYDLHLHYANFGTRTLMIRLPAGLPNPKAAGPYLDKDALHFVKDKQGAGGILCIEPSFDAGHDDDLMDLDVLVERLLQLRAEILSGDLRPLYLAHLAISSDDNHDPDEQTDVPIPAGLGKLTPAQRALMEFYGLGKTAITTAARNSPPLPDIKESENACAQWLSSQPEAVKNAWLAQLMQDPHTSVRSEIIAKYQKSRTTPAWPTA
jgi:hypothetical protein